MSVKIGNTEINKIPIGADLVSKVYVGEQRILPVPPINAFIDNIVSLGGNEDTVREGYSNVPYSIKDKASVILFPSYAEMYRLYAMDNNNGDVLPIYFSRASVGTYFDTNGVMQTAKANIPRIDSKYYQDSSKILFEKEAINSALNSDLNINANVTGSNYNYIDDTWNGVLTGINKAIELYLPTAAQQYSFYYRNAISKTVNVTYTASYFVRNELNSTPVINTNYPLNGDAYFVNSNGGGNSLSLINIKDGIYRSSLKYTGVSATTNGNFGYSKSPTTADRKFYLTGIQHEEGSVASSFIFTGTSSVTRSADVMKINLLKNCQVYIKTTTEEKYINKSAGVWNVSDDIVTHDGILCLAIMDDDAFDKDYFDSQFVKGHPIMTSNSTPSPYVTYSNSINSAAYGAWTAFNGRSGLQDGWVSANGTFNSDGTSVGTYPYVWLNLGSLANAKKFCKMVVRVKGTGIQGAMPRILSLGYSPTNNNDYTYQRFADLTGPVWSANEYTLTFYFEPPATPMQYWSLSVIEDNGLERCVIQDIQFFEDNH